VPGSVDLKGAARQNYTDTHTSPMQYDRSMYQGGLDALETHLQSPAGGVVKTPDNPVWAVLDYARKQTGSTPGVVTPYEIDAARQQLTGVSAKGASAVRQWLDDFMKSTHAVAGGTPADHAAVIESLDKARGNYRSGKRTQTIEEINQFAEDKGVTPQKALVGLLNPKSREGKWFTPDEKDAIRSTTNRYTMGNILSGAGNMLGGQLTPYSGTIGAGGAATAFMTGDWKPLVAGLGIPAIGYGVRKYGEHVAGQGAADLAATLAKNSPLYREAAANAPMIAGPGLGNVAESSRNAITLQLLDQLRNRGFMN
jgi:hypothetical protein